MIIIFLLVLMSGEGAYIHLMKHLLKLHYSLYKIFSLWLKNVFGVHVGQGSQEYP